MVRVDCVILSISTVEGNGHKSFHGKKKKKKKIIIIIKIGGGGGFLLL